MNSLMRTVVVGLFLSLLSLGIFGLRFACSPGDYQEFLRESRRQEELRELQRATLHRKDSQRQVVEEWIAGRCNLAEVMQRFEELDRESAQEWPLYRTLVPKKSPALDEERRYQIIRIYVEVILQTRPEELAVVLHRLEKDYQQLRADRKKPSTAGCDRKEKIIEREKKDGQ